MTELQAISLAQRIQENKEPLWQAIKRLSDEKDAEKEAALKELEAKQKPAEKTKPKKAPKLKTRATVIPADEIADGKNGE